MNGIARGITFLMGCLFGLMGIMFFVLGGVAASMMPFAFSGASGVMGLMFVGLGGLGLWAAIANRRSGIIIFAIVSCLFWYVGTLLGAIVLLMTLASGEVEQPAQPPHQ
ncbi:hypothetical protein QCD60_10235 [Pokkaliibacter sp. MBI-7]|uniref:hypothetical protein n=1 Tax=Pokkaliibacter sp. MBI-7 TaxID=3040600 RepID=UPI002447C112|nr:hypothetical protein [Pokkaliibacter sp. MBI-7]MDH2432944.1 hypothetical protein [Pokkaliibacter sp. MBI-7]